MTTDVFVRHYVEVADASPIPVLLYNVTMYTGCQPVAGRGRPLGNPPEHRRHEGIRERLAQIADFIARTPDDFSVLAGSAATVFAALCVGCDGATCACATCTRGLRAVAGLGP